MQNFNLHTGNNSQAIDSVMQAFQAGMTTQSAACDALNDLGAYVVRNLAGQLLYAGSSYDECEAAFRHRPERVLISWPGSWLRATG